MLRQLDRLRNTQVVRIDWSDDTILRDADTPDALAAMGG